MTSAEQLDLALWALNGNRVWLGLSVARRPERAEYVAIHLPRAYAAPALVPDTFSDDPWESLRLARASLQPHTNPAPLNPWGTVGMPWLVQITWERHRKLGIPLSEAIERTASENSLSNETLAQLRECFSPERTTP